MFPRRGNLSKQIDQITHWNNSERSDEEVRKKWQISYFSIPTGGILFKLSIREFSLGRSARNGARKSMGDALCGRSFSTLVPRPLSLSRFRRAFTPVEGLFNDVRANCFCASLLRTATRANSHATSCIERARQGLLMNDDRADGHCYSFAWI